MEDKNKNVNNQEPTAEDRTIRGKVFNYFYNILQDKKDQNLLASCIFIVLEMIQLISYAFCDPHKEIWKISDDTIENIATIIGALRLGPIMKYIDHDIYVIIFYILIVFIFAKIYAALEHGIRVTAGL